MPLITCEMRWIFDGRLPGAVERWLEPGPGARAVPSAWREDRYLVLPGAVDMGIKRREGRLEVKGCEAWLGQHAPARDIEGRAGRWCKWSYDGAAGKSGLRGLFHGHDTIVVAKRRRQWHFLLAPGGEAQASAQRDLARRGFSLEITRVRLGGGDEDTHWSLGIEAAPDDSTMLADLLRAMPAVLRDFPVGLPQSRSLSYPEWLAGLEPDA
jgi:hypothetical protein